MFWNKNMNNGKTSEKLEPKSVLEIQDTLPKINQVFAIQPKTKWCPM